MQSKAMGSLWDGTLSLEDFNSSVASLCERWKEVGAALPQWLWVPCPSVGASCCDAAGYLAMENVYHHGASEDAGYEESILGNEEPFDNATLAQSCEDDMRVYDYHIVYSFNYRVPVLYFRGYQCDGCPLKLDEIEKDLPAYSLKVLRESKWTFMTQEDHPYLQRPWYTLHPCGTSDWMKFLLGSDMLNKDRQLIHYLSAWLSVVSQATGLRIPLGLHRSL